MAALAELCRDSTLYPSAPFDYPSTDAVLPLPDQHSLTACDLAQLHSTAYFTYYFLNTNQLTLFDAHACDSSCHLRALLNCDLATPDTIAQLKPLALLHLDFSLSYCIENQQDQLEKLKDQYLQYPLEARQIYQFFFLQLITFMARTTKTKSNQGEVTSSARILKTALGLSPRREDVRKLLTHFQLELMKQTAYSNRFHFLARRQSQDTLSRISGVFSGKVFIHCGKTTTSYKFENGILVADTTLQPQKEPFLDIVKKTSPAPRTFTPVELLGEDYDSSTLTIHNIKNTSHHLESAIPCLITVCVGTKEMLERALEQKIPIILTLFSTPTLPPESFYFLAQEDSYCLCDGAPNLTTNAIIIQGQRSDSKCLREYLKRANFIEIVVAALKTHSQFPNHYKTCLQTLASTPIQKGDQQSTNICFTVDHIFAATPDSPMISKRPTPMEVKPYTKIPDPFHIDIVKVVAHQRGHDGLLPYPKDPFHQLIRHLPYDLTILGNPMVKSMYTNVVLPSLKRMTSTSLPSDTITLCESFLRGNNSVRELPLEHLWPAIFQSPDPQLLTAIALYLNVCYKYEITFDRYVPLLDAIVKQAFSCVELMLRDDGLSESLLRHCLVKLAAINDADAPRWYRLFLPYTKHHCNKEFTQPFLQRCFHLSIISHDQAFLKTILKYQKYLAIETADQTEPLLIRNLQQFPIYLLATDSDADTKSLALIQIIFSSLPHLKKQRFVINTEGKMAEELVQELEIKLKRSVKITEETKTQDD
ncbi:MAG: hypothetical protein KDK65_00020 [Chlamydiia bacterium]|nr:hypothetical protein [Chlamydiia bacterium]